MGKKLTTKQAGMIEEIKTDIRNLMADKKAIDKILKDLKDILIYNGNIGGPDIRYRHVTKTMKSYWDRGGELVSQSREKFRVLDRFYNDKINTLEARAKKIDPSFKI